MELKIKTKRKRTTTTESETPVVSKTVTMRKLALTVQGSPDSVPFTASKLAARLGWFRTSAKGATYPNSKAARRLAKRFGVPLRNEN